MSERVTSVSGFTLVCWALIAIELPPVRCVGSALESLPFRRVLGAFGFSPDRCEDKAHSHLSPRSSWYLLKLSSEGNVMLFDDIGHLFTETC